MGHIFQSVDAFRDILTSLPETDETAQTGAAARNGQLTKPPGALGRLEDVAIWFAGWQGDSKPRLRFPQVLIFAGNHGVMEQGVSAFPAEVTEQMVLNFQHGGAAINQLCKTFGAQMAVHPLSLDRPTADFTKGPAMSEEELLEALQTGWDAVNKNADLLVTGEMGIGNTTPASALCAALFSGGADEWTGRGTGVDDAGLANKTRVVAEGLANHAGQGDGLEMLRRLGGRELAAMAGAIARARVERIPVLLDGFICCAAAATLQAVNPKALDHALAGHVSAEGAHPKLLELLGKEPLLSLGLRLGEGSGAALAIGVLQGAIACHSGMATFAEAGVSDS
ncbi:nicotinate-nucleotide--dimethylbenzimidazole phosphoribosyltransferase [Thalassovita mediterranea]|jgi:nicotinate-nucleotide--dimethylbenzimidazole phosphoribosyltransferase|uniref:Nicotinate-nucleotide--dimethylbenzimidazole phosphoribosyltransferase n=1 Tax=Thalassovita mediterranea TaxID=340021 RepID=A0A0P1H2N6_9RHOB|nr:nicotinate-nucleotide--dimethylbenzimidazole phosphoribosyltransferase [Thalassovita mediterranea]MCG7574312.1 nicotinate-nucleotide--dimethylbenzimidazole phosphoribosyltransferase [Phaeobacter sp. CNT1-3]CUH83720.1 Nicotinate-nucleotide--dimethylbenzimidazole phosphoribosyltransferase [Thalassovita mediterranea]SIS28602.1 nicotinate-nucleotide-dimethylbenzimidazole phosphoribosyltransferase [Thalassovita mediterranea]